MWAIQKNDEHRPSPHTFIHHFKFSLEMATAQQQPYVRQKLALVIGNTNYSRSYNKLDYSFNNAIDLSDSLKKIGFNVTTTLIKNPVNNQRLKRS